MAMDAFIKAGLMNFGPKIIEVRFQTDAATAAVKEQVLIIWWQHTKRLTDRLGTIRMNESLIFSSFVLDQVETKYSQVLFASQVLFWGAFLVESSHEFSI